MQAASCSPALCLTWKLRNQQASERCERNMPVLARRPLAGLDLLMSLCSAQTPPDGCGTPATTSLVPLHLQLSLP